MVGSFLHALIAGCLLLIGLAGCESSPASDEAHPDEKQSESRRSGRRKSEGRNSERSSREKPSHSNGDQVALVTKTYRTPEELLDEMPEEAYPKVGPEFGIERAATAKWLEEELGPSFKVIEWEATIQGVSIRGDEPFQVDLDTGQLTRPLLSDWPEIPYGGVWAFGKPIELGGQKCQVGIKAAPGNVLLEGGRLSYYACTADEAKMLRGLKGKKVTLRGIVCSGFLSKNVQTIERNEFGFEQVPQNDLILITLVVPQIAVNGFIPASEKFLHQDRLRKDNTRFPGAVQLDGAVYKTPDGKLLVEFSHLGDTTYTCSFTVPLRDGKGSRHQSGVKFVAPNEYAHFSLLAQRKWIVFVESSDRVWTFDGSKLSLFEFEDGEMTIQDSESTPEIRNSAPEPVRNAISVKM